MENSTFFQTYLLIFIFCLAMTAGLIFMINKGMKKFFENLSADPEISGFFRKLSALIIFLGGVGAALKSGYNTSDGANWLTLTWDAAAQLQESIGRIFVTLMILAVSFFIVQLVIRRQDK